MMLRTGGGLTGLGFEQMADLPLCGDVHPPPGFVGPIPCIPDATGTQPAPGPATQTQIAYVREDLEELQSQVDAERAARAAADAAAGRTSPVVYIAVGVAALALFMSMRN